MKGLITFSVQHPVSVMMAVLALILLGIVSVLSVSVDFLPVISNRNILIATEYEGVSATEIQDLITIPLEDAFASLKGLKQSSALSRDGLALVMLEMHWGTDMDMSLIECREIVDIAFEALPSQSKKPVVRLLDSSKKSTISFAVIPKDGDLQYCRYIGETDIKPRLQRISGVGEVALTGGEKEQIEVRVQKDALESKKLTLQHVSDALSGSNFEYPAGTIYEGEKELLVKTSGLYTSIDEIGQTALLYNEGGVLRISDIGDVIQTVERKETFFVYEGQECLKLDVYKKNDANPIQTAKSVRNEIALLQQAYGIYYDFVVIEDLSQQVVSSLISLAISAVVGIGVTILIIYLFLRSGKSAVLLASIIPISACAAFLVIKLFGKTVNTMSLSGIAIGIGMVIDAGVVVIEKLRSMKIQGTNEERQKCIIEGTASVATSNVGSALTTMVVFIPVFFMAGLLGELFTDMALAVISSIAVSCILSLTYIPALFYLIQRKYTEKRNSIELKKLQKWYGKSLTVLLKRKTIAAGIILVCIGIGVVSFIFIDTELLPKLANKNSTIEILFENGTSIETILETAFIVSERLKQEPYIKQVTVWGGVEKDNYIALSDPATSKEKMVVSIETYSYEKDIGAKLSNLFDMDRFTIVFSQNNDLLAELLAMKDNVYVITNETQEEVSSAAKNIVIDSTQIVPNVEVYEYVFTPDRLAGARFSISALNTATLARNSLEGVESMPFYTEGREIPVWVKFDEESFQNVEDFENIGVFLEESAIPLRLLGTVTQELNEKVLYRYNRKDSKILKPPFVFSEESAETEGLLSLQKLELQEMIGNSMYLLFVIIILLYLVMGAQFESFVIPALFLLSLPPAFSGALAVLGIFGKSLNINSIIALVVLFGTSVNNAILLYESCVSKSVLNEKTIIASCKDKLRSILVTNITTICALIPFAIDPYNINAQSSLALAVIGGLLVSMIIVLAVIPVVFSVTLIKRKKNE